SRKEKPRQSKDCGQHEKKFTKEIDYQASPTVIANITIGQTTQALVYVPNAVPSGAGTENLMPLGSAANTARLHLEAGGTALPEAQASVAVNSLGLLDLVQIAATGLAPQTQYQVYLAESNQSPFGKLEPLAVLKTNPDGAMAEKKVTRSGSRQD